MTYFYSMLFRHVELAIADMDVVDFLFEKSFKLVNHRFRTSEPRVLPLRYRVGAVDAQVRTTAFCLDAALPTFIEIAFVIKPGSAHRRKVCQRRG